MAHSKSKHAMYHNCVDGLPYVGLKEEFVKFLESSMQFYTSLVELSEGSAGDSQSRRKVKLCLLLFIGQY